MTPGWQGPAKVLENSQEVNVTVKWQGRTFTVPNHLCRQHIQALAFWYFIVVPFLQCNEVLHCIKTCEAVSYTHLTLPTKA